MDEEETPRGLKVMGREVSKIPCFRNSFLYGIGTGLGAGTLVFLGTSRVRLATHVGFGSFFCTTMGYWMFCRYQWSKRRFEYQQLQTAMRKQAIYEGTEVERDLLKSA